MVTGLPPGATVNTAQAIMFWLIAVSLIWAFSFGLIKDELAGLDPAIVACCRLALALLVFLPWLLRARIRPLMALGLALVGAVQFGLMYLFYQASFGYLAAYEVALYTIFTPVYITLLDSLLNWNFRFRAAVAAVLAVLGAGLITWRSGSGVHPSWGFILLQLANLCFAAGQLFYKQLRVRLGAASDAGLFGWLLVGAVLVTALAAWHGAAGGGSFQPTWRQWGVLVYLGVLASGMCFFWWNLGALRVNNGVLAVFNNAKVPAGVLCSLLFFGEHADWLKLSGGLLVMLVALWVVRNSATRRSPAVKLD